MNIRPTLTDRQRGYEAARITAHMFPANNAHSGLTDAVKMTLYGPLIRRINRLKSESSSVVEFVEGFNSHPWVEYMTKNRRSFIIDPKMDSRLGVRTNAARFEEYFSQMTFHAVGFRKRFMKGVDALISLRTYWENRR